MRSTASVLALPVLVLAAVTLTGCSALTDIAHSESETAFADAAELRSDWGKADGVGWLPDDAREISIRESTKGDPAVMRFESADGLDPASCAETERRSLPVFVDDWTPDDEEVVKLDTVWACGSWAVVDIDGAWFGWTPSAPGEQESAP